MNRKGVTLVEVIVSMSVAAIMITAILAVVAPLYKMYDRTHRKSEALIVAETVLDVIREDVRDAAALSVTQEDGRPALALDRFSVTTSAEGYLVVNGEPALAPRYYNDMTVSLAFEKTEAFTALVTVSVYDGGEQLAEMTCTAVSLRRYLGN